MSQRLNYAEIAPEAYKLMLALEKYIRDCGLEASLLHLVKMRVSQMNGCAFCIDMHSKDARAHGETEQRLYGLSAWKETSYYTERERAALAWAETLTRLADTQDVPDAIYDAARQHFKDEELVNLTFVVTTINSWNRLAVGFRKPAGSYQAPSPPRDRRD